MPDVSVMATRSEESGGGIDVSLGCSSSYGVLWIK
jgi:hypothetical protein